MSNIDLTSYRGTRDFLPEEYFVQNHIYQIWRRVCQSYGYEEYQGPTVEPLSLYTAKTSQEIVEQQTFSFTDRGGRQITIRPEMTPTIARMVAGNQQDLGYPLRLFSIPNCMRYERPQKGRLREFWQLNADIFGVDGIEADVEIITLADSIMKAFGAEADQYEIRVNSRTELAKQINDAGLKTSVSQAVHVLDKLEKLPKDTLLQELAQHVDDPAQLIDTLGDGERENVKHLIERCAAQGVQVVDTPTLARGFDYYTDIVFEVFDTNPDNNRSMFGGGRYDTLVEQFGGQPVATVGFGMGDAVLEEFLRTRDLIPDYQPATQVYIIPIDSENHKDAEELAQSLRESGINTAIDYSGRKTDKQLKTALKHQIEYAIFIGSEEITSGRYTLKNLAEQTEKTLQLDELVKFLG